MCDHEGEQNRVLYTHGYYLAGLPAATRRLGTLRVAPHRQPVDDVVAGSRRRRRAEGRAEVREGVQFGALYTASGAPPAGAPSRRRAAARRRTCGRRTRRRRAGGSRGSRGGTCQHRREDRQPVVAAVGNVQVPACHAMPVGSRSRSAPKRCLTAAASLPAAWYGDHLVVLRRAAVEAAVVDADASGDQRSLSVETTSAQFGALSAFRVNMSSYRILLMLFCVKLVMYRPRPSASASAAEP